MASVERLMNEHAQITALSAELLDAIPLTDPGVLHGMLAHMDAIITRHLATEDTEVYPFLAAANDLFRREDTVNSLGGFHLLSVHWAAFVTGWTPELINADRGGFTTDSERVLGALHARIELEDEILYPLALSCGTLTLREVRAQVQATGHIPVTHGCGPKAPVSNPGLANTPVVEPMDPVALAKRPIPIPSGAEPVISG